MKNLLFEIAYNGANYHGYQVQPNVITVTEVLQDAIQKIIKKREDIIGCSRTDSKVHANSYYFNMKTKTQIPLDKLVILLNNSLPYDVFIKSCIEVPLDFHARYHCKAKEYIYKIYNGKQRDPFLSEYALQYQQPLDEIELNKISQELVGTYDFSTFCSSGAKKMNHVRTIYSAQVYRESDMVFFKIRGDGFLYNMVRIIVGTLLFMNEGKISKNAMGEILSSKDRTKAGKTAPPYGLYLNSVEY